MKTLADVRLISLTSNPNGNGTLVPIESGADIPFEIRRVFYVLAGRPVQRGRHAHRKCAQFLVCLSGACDVVCDDGRDRMPFRLEQHDQGLLLPPTIWAEQTYLEPNTMLMALCDQLYDEMDYIRDYKTFAQWRSVGNP